MLQSCLQTKSRPAVSTQTGAGLPTCSHREANAPAGLKGTPPIRGKLLYCCPPGGPAGGKPDILSSAGCSVCRLTGLLYKRDLTQFGVPGLSAALVGKIATDQWHITRRASPTEPVWRGLQHLVQRDPFAKQNVESSILHPQKSVTMKEPVHVRCKRACSRLSSVPYKFSEGCCRLQHALVLCFPSH